MNDEELSIEMKINEEFERLTTIYKELPEKEFEAVLPLIQNAAFLRVTLDRLQQSINDSAVTEEYKNGSNQSGRKTTAELQTYNNLVKDYLSITSKLIRHLPKENNNDQPTGLDAFLAMYDDV